MQQDRVLERVTQGIRNSSHVLLCSHIRSDPDSIGSELALAFLLEELDRTYEIANHGGVDKHCRWLPRANEIMNGPEQISGAHDTLVSVDCANLKRLGNMATVAERSEVVINIDHHVSNNHFGDVNWIIPDASSVGEMIYELWEEMEVHVHREAATCIYTSIVSDTGQFAFPQTSSRSHEVTARLLEKGVKPQRVSGKLFQDYDRPELDLMAYVINNLNVSEECPLAWSRLDEEAYRTCGTEPADSQPYVQLVMQLEGVEVGLLLRRLRGSDVSEHHQGLIKGSLRSKGTFDAGKLAGIFGGGGHAQAAGFVVEEKSSMREAEQYVIQRFEEAIKDGEFRQKEER